MRIPERLEDTRRMPEQLEDTRKKMRSRKAKTKTRRTSKECQNVEDIQESRVQSRTELDQDPGRTKPRGYPGELRAQSRTEDGGSRTNQLKGDTPGQNADVDPKPKRRISRRASGRNPGRNMRGIHANIPACLRKQDAIYGMT